MDMIEETETPDKAVIELEAKLIVRSSTGPVSEKNAK